MAHLGLSTQISGQLWASVGARQPRNRCSAHAQSRSWQNKALTCRASRISDDSLSLPHSQKGPEAGRLCSQPAQSADPNITSEASHNQTPAQRPFPAAFFAALRMTQAFRIVAHAASYLVLDLRHGLFRKARQTQQGLSHAQQTIQQAVVQPAQTISQAESELKAAWTRLQQHAVAGGDALMKMLHSLDKPSITLDKKWADMQEQLAGNKDVSDRLQTLFASSVESTQTVATMLAQSGGKLQHSYWTSPQTKKVIDQEEELRSVVFAQMLGATS